jgi:hypothetical protein
MVLCLQSAGPFFLVLLVLKIFLFTINFCGKMVYNFVLFLLKEVTDEKCGINWITAVADQRGT